MAKITAVAGTKFYIGTQATLQTTSGTYTNFATYATYGDTFTLVGTVMDAGTLGATAADIKVETIGNAIAYHLKGVVDPGTVKLVLANDLSDAGQQALETARASTSQTDYNFRYVFPNVGTYYGDIIDVAGKVTGFDTAITTPNNPVKANVTLGLNSVRSFTAAK